jgi:hypothetical protein
MTWPLPIIRFLTCHFILIESRVGTTISLYY